MDDLGGKSVSSSAQTCQKRSPCNDREPFFCGLFRGRTVSPWIRISASWVSRIGVSCFAGNHRLLAMMITAVTCIALTGETNPRYLGNSWWSQICVFLFGGILRNGICERNCMFIAAFFREILPSQCFGWNSVFIESRWWLQEVLNITTICGFSDDWNRQL